MIEDTPSRIDSPRFTSHVLTSIIDLLSEFNAREQYIEMVTFICPVFQATEDPPMRHVKHANQLS